MVNETTGISYALLMREKQLRDEYNAIEDARDEGKLEGKLEGIQIGEERGKINTAINLLDILDDDTIALKLELPLETVQSLRKEQDLK